MDEGFSQRAVREIRARHGALFADIHTHRAAVQPATEFGFVDFIRQRNQAVHELTIATVGQAPIIARDATRLLAMWMDRRGVVRLMGTPHALRSARVASQRLIDGGARVITPHGLSPPQDILHGGGIIALATSDKNNELAGLVENARIANRDVKILGLGPIGLSRLANSCNLFLGIPTVGITSRGATYGTEEHVIAELLDALIVFAGLENGYSETRWRDDI
jgi:hypothetical protein